MKENCINVPEAMKGQLEPEGTLEIGYKLVDSEGGQYLQVTDIEGQTVESVEPENPLDKMANKMGVPKKFGAKKPAYEEGL
jgi:hypothetical protein